MHTSEVCRCACPEVWIRALPFMGDDPSDSLWALECRKSCANIFFLVKSGYWVLVRCASLTHVCTMHHKVCLIPNSIWKRYPHLGFCIVGLKGSLKDHVSWILEHDFKVDTQIWSKRSPTTIASCLRNLTINWVSIGYSIPAAIGPSTDAATALTCTSL